MAVDYDPQKAHEYYEKHKKLKGKKKKRKSRSTKGWTQTQKEQYAYAKEQLRLEHKSIGQGITNQAKMSRQEMSEKAKSLISNLRNQLKGMSKEQKAVMKERIQGMIANIRSDLKLDKAELSAQTKSKRKAENAAYEVRKDKAYETIKAMGKKKKKG